MPFPFDGKRQSRENAIANYELFLEEDNFKPARFRSGRFHFGLDFIPTDSWLGPPFSLEDFTGGFGFPWRATEAAALRQAVGRSNCSRKKGRLFHQQ